jgi:hypothetical protein
MADMASTVTLSMAALQTRRGLNPIGYEQYTYAGIILIAGRRLQCAIARVVYDTWTDYQAMRAHSGVFVAKTRLP